MTEEKKNNKVKNDEQIEEIKEHIEAEEAEAERPKNASSNDERHENTRPEAESAEDERPVVEGILDLAEGGFGFLRFNNFLTSEKDVYVAPTQIRRFNLKTGDLIKGISRRPKQNERFGALLYVQEVNGEEPSVAKKRPQFEDLTPIFPNERLTLESGAHELATRLIDLIAPIGKGQRGMIAAPPKAGKTTLLKQMAQAIWRLLSFLSAKDLKR